MIGDVDLHYGKAHTKVRQIRVYHNVVELLSVSLICNGGNDGAHRA